MPPLCTSNTDENTGIFTRLKDQFRRFADRKDLDDRALGNRIDDIVP